jgi:P-type Cu+ transporter
MIGEMMKAENRLTTLAQDIVAPGHLVVPRPIQPGVPTSLVYRLMRAATGTPLADVVVSHEKPIHLIAVRRDLTEFQHVHPESTGSPGEYAIDVTFPVAGTYLLFAEFARASGEHALLRDEPVVGTPSTQAIALVYDRAPRVLGDDIDDVQVSLLGADAVWVGRESRLSFRVEYPRTGTPVRDLQPYLGAPAHVVILSQDGQTFAHTHGTPSPEGDHTSAGHGAAGVHDEHEAAAKYGPEITFHHTFPAPGSYKVWGQFKDHLGRVLTADFVVHAW